MKTYFLCNAVYEQFRRNALAFRRNIHQLLRTTQRYIPDDNTLQSIYNLLIPWRKHPRKLMMAHRYSIITSLLGNIIAPPRLPNGPCPDPVEYIITNFFQIHLTLASLMVSRPKFRLQLLSTLCMLHAPTSLSIRSYKRYLLKSEW